VSATIAVRDIAGELSAKNAELAAANAALKAAQDALAAEKAARASDSATAKAASDLAKATYIAEYNALAKKWNAKNPRAKVKLKK
jgi:hypothetical protein